MNYTKILLVNLIKVEFMSEDSSNFIMMYNFASFLINIVYLTIEATDVQSNLEQHHSLVESVETTSVHVNTVVANRIVLTSYQTVKERNHKKTLYLLSCICCLFVLGGIVFSVIYDPKLIGLSFFGLVMGVLFMLKIAFNGK